ncbi:hypothetical protein AAF712_016909, partial [Marasmius tenuissimus]
MKESDKEFRAIQKEEMNAIKEAKKGRKKGAGKPKKSSAAGRASKGKMREVQSSPVVSSTPIPKMRATPKSTPSTVTRTSTYAKDNFNAALDSDSDLPELADVLLSYRKGLSPQTTPIASTST